MSSAERRVVLVLGPGRSGTSTVAGLLAHSGFSVPDAVAPEESNPVGFFEPEWVMKFHLDLLERAGHHADAAAAFTEAAARSRNEAERAMLRHPSEVASSRAEFYQSREISAVAGWVNVALMTERLTRGSARSVVHYHRLTTDWRTEAVRLRDHLGLSLDPEPEVKPHPVDDFIDPTLRRVTSSLDDLALPPRLHELTAETWEELNKLADEGLATAGGTP